MVEMIETGVTYEELADIEREFEQVETEMRKFLLPPSHNLVASFPFEPAEKSVISHALPAF